MKLDLFGGTSGTYSGLDAFGRVVDHLWYDYGASSDVDRYQYGFDRLGNPLWKENAITSGSEEDTALDEIYDYDDLYRLIAVERGRDNSTHDEIEEGTLTFSQSWDLDGQGNWAEFDTDADVTVHHNRSRRVV